MRPLECRSQSSVVLLIPSTSDTVRELQRVNKAALRGQEGLVKVAFYGEDPTTVEDRLYSARCFLAYNAQRDRDHCLLDPSIVSHLGSVLYDPRGVILNIALGNDLTAIMECRGYPHDLVEKGRLQMDSWLASTRPAIQDLLNGNKPTIEAIDRAMLAYRDIRLAYITEYVKVLEKGVELGISV